MTVNSKPIETAKESRKHKELTGRNRICIRWTLALVCALLSLAMIMYAWHFKSARVDPRVSVGELPYNDMTKAAIDLRAAESKNLFDVGLLLLGVLWGLIIAKREEVRIRFSDHPELIMFGLANALLLLSFVWHNFYLEEMRHYYVLGAETCFSLQEKCIPDVFAMPLNYLYTCQAWFLLLGGLVAVATLVSAHMVRESVG